MNWTLNRYVASRFLKALLGSVLIVSALIFIASLVELLRRSAGRTDFVDLAVMAAFQTPGIALQATPFVVLLASMASFAQLARSSELVVARAAGVSGWGLVAPVMVAATLTGIATFMVFDPVAAAMTQRFGILEARHFDGRGSRLSVSSDGLWLRQGDQFEQIVILARESNSTATELTRVTLFRFGEGDALIERVDAAQAQLKPGEWLLRDAVSRPLDTEVADAAGAVRAFRSPGLAVPTELTSSKILDSFARPESISFWALPGFIQTLETAGFSAQRHRLHWHGQLALPLLFCAMALIGAAFSMRHSRFGGLGAMAFGAVITGFAFYFIADVAKALGASGAVPALLGAWAPPLAAAMVATTLMLQAEDG